MRTNTYVAMLVLTASLMHCGPLEGNGLNTTIHFDQALHTSSVDALKTFIMKNQRTNGFFMSCSELKHSAQLNSLPNQDPTIVLLHTIDISLTDAYTPVQVNDIQGGEGYLIFVIATDSASTVLAYGCLNGVVVKSNESTDVTLSVSAF
jgi:hypothetical protein